jgi:hypothetical protein
MKVENIFICHATEDSGIAKAIKKQFDKVFDNDIKVFVSSIPGTIPPGSDWLDSILSNLKIADAFLIVLTPTSQNRLFVWFEIGFSWLRKINNKCEMYVLFANPIKGSDLPRPLDRLQATSMSSKEDLKAFFEKIAGQFKRGNKNAPNFEEIFESIPMYPEEVRDKKENNEKLKWEKPFYWRIDDEKKDGPFCQKCYDSNKKLIRLQEGGNDVWRCFSCKSTFRGPRYNPPSQQYAIHEGPRI